MTNEFLESIGQALGLGDGSSGGFDISSIFGSLSLAENKTYNWTRLANKFNISLNATGKKESSHNHTEDSEEAKNRAVPTNRSE